MVVTSPSRGYATPAAGAESRKCDKRNDMRRGGLVLRVVLSSAALTGLPAPAWSQGGGQGSPLPAETLALPADMDVLMGVDARALFDSADYKSLLAGQPLPGVPAAALGDARDSI